MSTDTQNFSDKLEKEATHSAFTEFSRDERRPAVLLLAALVIAVLFFALGILFGRWTSERTDSPPTMPSGQPASLSPLNQPSASPSATATASPTAPRARPKPTPGR